MSNFGLLKARAASSWKRFLIRKSKTQQTSPTCLCGAMPQFNRLRFPETICQRDLPRFRLSTGCLACRVAGGRVHGWHVPLRSDLETSSDQDPQMQGLYSSCFSSGTFLARGLSFLFLGGFSAAPGPVEMSLWSLLLMPWGLALRLRASMKPNIPS